MKRKSTETITEQCFPCQNKSVCQKLARSCKKWKSAKIPYTPFLHGALQLLLVYTTQVNSTFRAHWFVSSEVISQVLFTSNQPKKNKNGFCRPIFTNKVTLWAASYSACVVYTKTIILLFTSVPVKVVDIYLTASRLGKYPPLFTSTSVNNC